jgi:hypothetical protein
MVFSTVDVCKSPRLAHSLREDWPIDNDALKAELYAVEKVVGWNEDPVFSRIGRSALHIFQKPIYISSVGHYIRAAKIKGVGAKTHLDQIIQPTSIPLHNKNPHLGFKDNKFCPVFTAPAPIGGITLDRARREFQVSKGLVENSCPSVVPLQVYEYTDQGMVFNSSKDIDKSSLGVVITGLPNSHDLRVDSVFKYYDLPSDQLAIVDSWMHKLNISSTQNPVLSLISKLSKMYGKTIRKFSESGFYRYSGAPDNYSYNEETGKVFLIDLDSSLKLSEVSYTRQSLEVMRDAASGIAYLIAFLTNPKYIKKFPIEDVLRENPFQELLIGYYSDVDTEYIKHLSILINQYYKKVYANSLVISESQNEVSSATVNGSNNLEEALYQFQSFLSQSYMRPWIDRREAFSHVMPVCLLLHKKSKLMKSFSSTITIHNMLLTIEDYVSPETSKKISTQLKNLITSTHELGL